MNAIRIGTSGWSYDDWVGPFYPPRTAQADYLGCYCRHFDVVEVDSTFYRPPTDAMVRAWAARTPDQFQFALKMPRSITHEKLLRDCDRDMDALLPTLALLGTKLRSVLLQFGYFNRAAFAGPRPFFDRLEAFLRRYAPYVPLACEIRNKNWLTPDYFLMLREHGVAAALVEHAWLPPIEQLAERADITTANYAYVRLIGDREGIEKIATNWSRIVVNRSSDLRRIASALRKIAASADTFVFVNNHYAGHGPESCRLLRTVLDDPA